MASDIGYRLISKGSPPNPNTVVATFKSNVEPAVGDQLWIVHLARWYVVNNRVIVMTTNGADRVTEVYYAVTAV